MIDDPFAEPLVRAVGVDFLTRWATGELNGDDLDVEGSGWGLQHMPAAMAARTMYFDAFFADAAAAGIRQAVILASGLDARAYRLGWPADMTVFEIDQPEVIAFKTTTLDGLGAEPKAELRTVAIDLRDDWPTALKARGFRPPSSRRPGSRRACSAICRPRPRTACWTPSPSSARPGSRIGHRSRAEHWRTSTPMRPGADAGGPPRSGVTTASNSTSPSWASTASATTSASTSTPAAGQSVGTPMSELLVTNGFPAIPQPDDEDGR